MNITGLGASLRLQTLVTADTVIVDVVAAKVVGSSSASLSRQKQTEHHTLQ
jgi:hypothetical protein